MPWKDSGFACLRFLNEGFLILEPPFPEGGLQDSRASVPLRQEGHRNALVPEGERLNPVPPSAGGHCLQCVRICLCVCVCVCVKLAVDLLAWCAYVDNFIEGRFPVKEDVWRVQSVSAADTSAN